VRPQHIISLIIIILTFISAIYLYPSMPDRIPVHWDFEGQADEYSPKIVGLFVMPIVSLLLFLLMSAIPKMAVHKKNIKEIEPKLATFILIFILIFSAIYAAGILQMKGFNISMTKVSLISIAVLFFYISHLIKDIKKNFFIGIRTPWTLSSAKVWKKTHKMGSKLFIVFAILFLIASFFPVNFWIVKARSKLNY